MLKKLLFYIRYTCISLANFVKKLFGKDPAILPPKPDSHPKHSADVGTRYPEDYLKTFSSKADSIDRGKIPWITGSLNIPHNPPLFEWNHLSKQILKEFFTAVGVEYVPEIVIHALKEQDTLSAFTEFCSRFDYPDGNRSSREYLQNVVLFLFEMDMLRKKTPLNPDPIYQALEQHRWTYAEKLLESMKKVSELLEKLNSKGIYLGIHRQMIYNAGELLSLSWYEHLKHLDQLYEAHLEWQEKEDQYLTFQKFIAGCIKKIDRKQFHLRELSDTYKNIKSLWIEIQDFLEEKEGDPADEELGFPMLSEICKALGSILDAIDEEFEYPADEDDLTFEEAWNILVKNLEQDDIDSASRSGIDIQNPDIKKITTEFAKHLYRRASLKIHPDRGGSNEDFIILTRAYEKILKELKNNGKQ